MLVKEKVNRPKITNLLGGWTKLFLDSDYVKKYVSDVLKILKNEQPDIPDRINVRVFVAASQIVNGTNVYLEFAVLNTNLFIQSTLFIPPGKDALVKQLFFQKFH